jgi:membrane protease YdiL (CAAX protease family)
MKKIILFAAIFEFSYLTLSFVLAKIYGQWSYEGEIIRTVLRVVSILYYAYLYRKYCIAANQSLKEQKLFTPQFIAAIFLLLLVAIFYTNAEHETLRWQLVFAISGITAGLREELFYRGMVQNILQTKYGYRNALLATSVLFTLCHIQYIYYGQTKGLMLIALAGIIFGSIFIYTGSVVFTALIHGLYDAVLSVNIVPYKLSNASVLPILFLVTLIFLIIINEKLYVPRQTDKTGDTDPDNISWG